MKFIKHSDFFSLNVPGATPFNSKNNGGSNNLRFAVITNITLHWASDEVYHTFNAIKRPDERKAFEEAIRTLLPGFRVESIYPTGKVNCGGGIELQ